ncbi:MAG: ABC transporter substrate-binding protein [Acetobacteraceae bacterium]
MMSRTGSRCTRRISRRQALAGAAGMAAVSALPAEARAAGEPMVIGIIAETSTLLGAGIPKGAAMAAVEINAKGGVLGRPVKLVVYDDHVSATEAVRAFQRLVHQDKAVAVMATFVSEIALALEAWAARLKTPFITPGAASNEISAHVHAHYERYRHTFHGYFTSYFIAESVADSARDLLVDQLHMKSCVLMSENAAWSTPYDSAMLGFLPERGLAVRDHIRFSPDTTDYAPIFNKIEAKKPDVIISGLAHVGVVPMVQWQARRVPIPMYGVDVQATSAAFWKDTHGAAEGANSQTAAGPDSAITKLTRAFTEAYRKRYRSEPVYSAYTSYDMLYVLAAAIARVGSTDAEKMVGGLEATDHVGTIGRIKFYGRKDRFTHALEYGRDLVPGVMIQWQQAQLKTIWPVKFATAKIAFPPFVRLPT